MVRNFIEYLKGNREADFDVYKATSMAATAIQAWRSVLDATGQEFYFNGVARDIFAGDAFAP